MEQKEKINFGAIGTGRVFNRAHGPALIAGEKTALKAVFDLDQQAATEAAKKYNCQAQASLEDLLQDPSIDIINICTPHDTHKEIILKVLDSGKYCLSEKPLCLKKEEAEEILNNKNIDKLFTLYQNRFNPAVRFLTDLVERGELGQLRACSVALRWWRPDQYFEDWHGEMKRVGGMLFNQASHILDIMRKVCGEAENVNKLVKIFRKGTDVDDLYVANAVFKNGIIGNIEVTTYAKPKDWEVSILVVGDKGVVKIGGLSINEVEYADVEGKDYADAPQKYNEEIPDGYGNSHPRVFAALAEHLLGGERHPSLVSGKEGIATTEFISKLYN